MMVPCEIRETNIDGLECIEICEGSKRLTVCPESGAEVTSFVWPVDGEPVEWLYGADAFANPPEGWRGRAPLLWPAVGRNFTTEDLERVKAGKRSSRDCSYAWNGRRFEIPIHGFAMNKTWTIEETDAARGAVVCSLVDDEETRLCYRFGFKLSVEHALRSYGFSSTYEVRAASTNGGPMPFCIGNHITFRLPVTKDGAFDRASVRAPARLRLCLTESSLLSGKTEEMPFPDGVRLCEEGVCDMVLGGFDKGNAWVSLTDGKVEITVIQAELSDRQRVSESGICFVFYGHRPDPTAGTKGFFCPEPWIGYPNSLNTKQGLVLLPPGETFRWRMCIAVAKR